MKTIKWLSIPLALSAAILGVWILTPNALGAVWSRPIRAAKLIVVGKTKLTAAVTCTAPNVPVAALDHFACKWAEDIIGVTADAAGTQSMKQRRLHCSGGGIQTISADKYVLALAAGLAGPYLSRSGSDVIVPVSTGDIITPDSCLDEWQALADATWVGLWDKLLSWHCARNPVIAGQIDCEASVAEQGTSVQFLDAGGGTPQGPHLEGVIQ